MWEANRLTAPYLAGLKVIALANAWRVTDAIDNRNRANYLSGSQICAIPRAKSSSPASLCGKEA